MSEQKGFSLVEVVVVIVVVVLIVGAGLVWWQRPVAAPSDHDGEKMMSASSPSSTPKPVIPLLSVADLQARCPTLISGVQSPDGKKTLEIRQLSTQTQYRGCVAVVTKSGTILLKVEEPVGLEDWFPVAAANWSSNNNYVYIDFGVPDGHDVDIFRTDRKNFTSGTSFIDVVGLAEKQLKFDQSLLAVDWVDATHLKVKQGFYGPIAQPADWVPQQFIVDVANEKISRE